MTKPLPLIVTRAEPGAAATVRRAAAMGLDARAMPLFAAQPLPWSVPRADDFDALLLTSARAVRLAGAGLAQLAKLPVYCVGQATAEAARGAGLAVAMVGDQNAQRVLDAMASRQVADILWLCGYDRSAFDAPGTALTALPCYRVDPVGPPAPWAATIAAPAVLLAHSVRGAARISELVGAMRDHLSLVAISAAVAAAAGEGWAARVVSGRPDDAAMLAEAHALCHKGE